MAYDNTNSGAAFKPFDTMKMILQGKVNLEGNDRKVVLVADKTKSGMKIIEIYQKVGVLFENDKKGNDNAPDYSGPLEDYAANKPMQFAGWKKQKDDGNYLSLQVSEKRSAGGGAALQAPASNDKPGAVYDDIPF
tara:strand:- start:180 stop:584 length:405 start_codon:yes stop_codon:yes gene_type:complete